jgi:hypothetical protein
LLDEVTLMKHTKKKLCIGLALALVVIGVRAYFTQFFGYGISPILVETIAFLLVLILAMTTYVRADRNRRTLLFFLPIFVVASMPLLFWAATFVAWSFGGFSP